MPDFAISEFLKLTSGHYLFWQPESEIWAENVGGGQSYTRKSQFSLNAHNFEKDGYFETAKMVLGSFQWLVSGYHVTLLYDAGKYPKTSVFR